MITTTLQPIETQPEQSLHELLATTKLLKTNPNCGQIEELLMFKNYRRIIDGNHKIIYFIENESVIIVTVFDCRQNPDKLISLL